MKQILKSKRGIALESAVLFMLIIFSLCALLTSLSLIGHYQLKIEKTVLLNDVEIDQIGEDYLASLKSGEEKFTESYENYEYKVDGNALTVWCKNDREGVAVLYVEAEVNGEQVDVLKWRYSTPTE
jgi:hypothetical protein